MSDTPTPETEAPPRRWTLTFSPTPDRKEADITDLSIHAPDVYAWEIVYTLSRVLTHFAAQPGLRLPTVEEEAARKVEAELVRAHPARQLLVRSGAQLWLGEDALREHGEALKRLGWIDAGPVPEGVQRACSAHREPEALAQVLAEAATPPVPEKAS